MPELCPPAPTPRESGAKVQVAELAKRQWGVVTWAQLEEIGLTRRNFLADYFESWEYVRMEPEDFIEVGEDHVVVLLHLHMRGKGSGIEVEAQTINVWTVSDA